MRSLTSQTLFRGGVPRKRHSVWSRLLAMYDRYLQRRALAELDDTMLRDVAITREDVERECAKPFWR